MSALAEQVGPVVQLVAGEASVQPLAPLPGGIELVEELVQQPERVDARCAERSSAQALLPPLLGLALGGLLAFSLVQGALMIRLGVAVGGVQGLEPLLLVLAYVAGLFGSLAAALPAVSLSTVLLGIEIPPWRLVVALVRSLSEGVLLLVGLTPLYLLVLLGLVVLAPHLAEGALYWGFGLPFGCALMGRRRLQRSLGQMTGEESAGVLFSGLLLVDGASAVLVGLAAATSARVLLLLVGGQ